MSRGQSNKKKKNIVVPILTILFILILAILIYYMIRHHTISVLSSVIGIVILTVTLNLANIVQIDEDNVNFWSIISILLIILSIPFFFVKAMYSYIIIAPACILAFKSNKKETRNTLTKIAFVFSIIGLIASIAFFSIYGYLNVAKELKL